MQSSPSGVEKAATVTGHKVPTAGTGGTTATTTWTQAEWERQYFGDSRWPIS